MGRHSIKGIEEGGFQMLEYVFFALCAIFLIYASTYVIVILGRALIGDMRDGAINDPGSTVITSVMIMAFCAFADVASVILMVRLFISL